MTSALGRGQRPIRVGNCSGFYGDRASAMADMARAGGIDVLTGDYLAEVTMLILGKARAKDSTKGYATTFLRTWTRRSNTSSPTGSGSSSTPEDSTPPGWPTRPAN